MSRYKLDGYWNRAEGRGRNPVYEPVEGFQYTIETTAANETYYPNYYVETGGTMTIDWGDGSTAETYTDTQPYPEHEYAVAGEYQVSITALDTCVLTMNFDGNLTSVDTKIPSSFVLDSFSLADWFKSCKKLESVIDGIFYDVSDQIVLSSGELDMTNIFNDCDSLDIDSDLFLQAVTNLDYSVITGLTDINIGNAISDCTAMTTLTDACLDNLRGRSENIKAGGFAEDCTGLLLFPTGIFDSINLTYCNSAFEGDTGITNDVDDLWNDFPLIVQADYRGCFYNCTSATNYASIPGYWKIP